jgi:hypothetical protein
MTDYSDSKKQLKIQEGIRRSEDILVLAIQDALDKTTYGDLEESQFRNLVRVSDTTESTEVIKNFLRYQVGRDKKWGRGTDSLASKIIQDIDHKIKNLAGTIAKEVDVETEKTSNDVQSIWLELTRRYLGYGARYLTYKRKGQT